MKIDDLGDVVWTSDIMMYVSDFVKSNDNGFLVTGNGTLYGVKQPETYYPQIGVIKTDSNGENDCECLNSCYIP